MRLSSLKLAQPTQMPYNPETLSSAEPYEFLVKLRNITWEANYVIVSQNALGIFVTFCQPSISPPPPSRTTKCPLLSLHYPYNPI
jgi:hypothetical protein